MSERDDLIQAVAEMLLSDYSSEYEAGHMTWRAFTEPAERIVAVAEQPLRNAVAREIRDAEEAGRFKGRQVSKVNAVYICAEIAEGIDLWEPSGSGGLA